MAGDFRSIKKNLFTEYSFAGMNSLNYRDIFLELAFIRFFTHYYKSER